jgi:hypothetical protein
MAIQITALPRHGGGGVDAGGVLVEGVLGHDHVDVLDRGDEGEGGDGQRRFAGEGPERVMRPVALGRPEPPPEQEGQDHRGDGQRGARADVAPR